jgi:hypothetical protein
VLSWNGMLPLSPNSSGGFTLDELSLFDPLAKLVLRPARGVEAQQRSVAAEQPGKVAVHVLNNDRPGPDVVCWRTREQSPR